MQQIKLVTGNFVILNCFIGDLDSKTGKLQEKYLVGMI